MIVSPNETAAAQLEDGRVYLNIRSQASYRAHAYSANGATNWQDYAPDTELVDARCFGSLATLRTKSGKTVLLFANCASPERDHVTLRASLDGGKTFAHELLLDETRGGYVEVAADSERGVIFVLYEEDYGARCHLVRIYLEA
jgi:sialidase-1